MHTFKPLISALFLAICAAPAGAFDARLTTDDPSLRDTLAAASATLRAKADGLTAADEIIAAAQSDYRNLVGALYRAGYYGPTVSVRIDGREAASLSLIDLPTRVESVSLTVETGPRFSFGRATVAPLAQGTETPAEFATGQPALAGEVGAAKDAAIDGWRDASHAKARLADQSIVADHPNRTLDVALTIDPGPSVSFGRLRFGGTSAIPENRLRRIGNLNGGRFTPDEVARVARRYQKTGAFRSVTVREAETLGPDGKLDLDVLLEDAKPRRFGFGAEVSSLEGGRVTAYWVHRNLTNHADRFRVDAELSGIGGANGLDSALALNYRLPAHPVRKTTLILGIEAADTHEPNYRERRGQFTIGGDIESDATARVEYAVGYRYSIVDDGLGRREFRHVIFPIEGYRDRRDDALDPQEGHFYAVELTPFVGIRGSASGARLSADGRVYRRVGDRLTFAARGQLGAVFGAGPTDVPPEMLFFSGGGGTVRGQPYQSLDIDVGGTPLGGTGFVGLSAEVRSKITDKIGVVGFADFGGLSAGLPWDAPEWHAGAGLGLRYDTGFGPIRLDIAAPVSGSTGDGVQFYIGIGQAF